MASGQAAPLAARPAALRSVQGMLLLLCAGRGWLLKIVALPLPADAISIYYVHFSHFSLNSPLGPMAGFIPHTPISLALKQKTDFKTSGAAVRRFDVACNSFTCASLQHTGTRSKCLPITSIKELLANLVGEMGCWILIRSIISCAYDCFRKLSPQETPNSVKKKSNEERRSTPVKCRKESM